jgi:hypothetical protein
MAEWKKVEMSPSHDFEKEKELEGVVTGIQTDVGPNSSTLYEIEKRGGENIAVWGSTVLDSRMKNVKIGEEVKIVFTGLAKEAKRGQNRAKIFEVYHREPTITSEDIDEISKGIK